MTKESGFVIINHVVKTTQKFIAFEPLAQAAEHLPFKQGVPGSIPGWLTKGVLDKPIFYDGGFAVMVSFGTK